MAEPISVHKMSGARIPTDVGEFTLCLYHNNLDGKEHLALLVGDVGDAASLRDGAPLLVRVHSECFTGDVLGSLRCDCGPQLAAALRLVAAEGRGVILYLRQEGRGIGLLEKLRAYNLQDVGYDTVDANLLLGHQPDLRDYRVAAEILKDLGITSLRLMTNNPDKIAGLERHGLHVAERVPLQMTAHAENAHYLDTKARRMRHLLQLENPGLNGSTAHHHPVLDTTGDDRSALMPELSAAPPPRPGRPYITLSYAQSLDGSIAARRGEQTFISGPEAGRLTHQLRARHDAILVGIGTVLADDPQLTVRLVRGPDPQPVIVDSRLRFPPWAKLLRGERRPWIATTDAADPARQAALEAAGARVIRLPAVPNGMVDLTALLAYLARRHMRSVMVEGGATVISNFLAAHLADRLVLTIAPMILGGLNAVADLGRLNGRVMPRLVRPQYQTLGKDVILFGDLVWE
ncbi:Riboflavin-specific deaminase/GTP cyclohydrolase II [Candidatus Promineifilum breve]|uniref:GTP cyclohydrolase-2 n=1 Tax=Candidatus Promineifilum breve TaxID=1806508 RepID=A0A160T6A3_9CHLR|nr:GTP cyclohydrolase II [Candidatus Promineifilum breve]CUS04778.2 Riboflavin-specific deaminase/GTP cyclohydrolase II [Candidatus Promineifilum breve]